MISYAAIIRTPFAKIGVRIKEDKLSGITFLAPNTDECPPTTLIAERVVEQLNAYFLNPLHVFTIDLSTHGTPFQQKIWSMLRTIPSGTTMTYGELALALNTSPRAIGQGCRTNPIGIIIPCHRVVAKNGLGGFAGERSGFLWETKQYLLHHESQASSVRNLFLR